MTSSPSAGALPADLAQWLAAHADGLDSGAADPAGVLPRLAQAGLFRIGVPQAQGGSGGTTTDAVEAVAAVAGYSQTAAFVLWGQRAFIEYVLHTPNRALAARLLPALLDGSLAGATGLSNAMKFLGGIEALQVSVEARAQDGDTHAGWLVGGVVPWATNLHPAGFAVAVAAADTAGHAGVYAIPSGLPGVLRSADLDLIGLRSSYTASVRFDGVALDAGWLLHEDAHQFLPRVRPAFLGLQCGLAIGLARRAIAAAQGRPDGGRSVLDGERDALAAELAGAARALHDGLERGDFLAAPRALFGLRIRLVELAMAAVQLELQARGGAGYLHGRTDGFARRWREAAFLPIVTPSLVQLKTELARQAAQSGQAAA
ncbi:acyl-CoA dehydrogenase family protein [Cupriavidus sp. 30B13]|uniref:acyl-CoA dehydrogenase family protein n=1 Tax=Cupriavidus sp. 30B13 TaxID=3384241 RepID=UPI003B91B4EE